MKQRTHVQSLGRAMQAVLLPLIAAACHGLGSEHATLVSGDSLMHTSKHVSTIQDARTLVSSPLRNRMRVELKAPVAEVWALMGDLPRFPEYSSGLERVEARRDSGGRLTGYVCHFKPQEEGRHSIVHREIMRWYEPNRGYASSAEENNAFGLTNHLNLVSVEPSKAGTILTWDEYYDAPDLAMNKDSFHQAFVDTAEKLIHRFGGSVLEQYVEQSP